jgi:hypothetical protein
MDSGNSGSMQSSSCGDEIEEYDSRGESNQFSMFLNNPPLSTPTAPATAAAPRTRSISHHLLNPPPQSVSLQQQMFDPLANYYMDSLQKSSSTSNQNSFLNLDMMWSKGTTTARSEQNNNDLSTLMIPSSSSTSSSHHQNQQAILLSQGMMVGQTRENINVVGSVPTTHHSLSLDHHHQQRGTSLTNDQQNLQNNNNNMGSRNPKKRSRASRRAPTTVLTTDTTNFRAMVQEFTGIPAPPFSSPFPRTRLDLFGSSRSISSSSSHMDPPQQPPYLLRPFAHKIHHSFPPSSSSMVENLLASNNSATINYHNLSQHQQNHHPPPLIQQHNQILGFQSISQTPTTKYQIGSHQQPSLEITPNVDSHIKRGSVFEDLSHVNNTNIGNVVHHRQNMVPTSSDRVNNNMCNSSSENQWGTRTSSTSINGGDHGGILGSLSGIEERNCTSDFGLVKGQECAVVATTTTRGEGTVESWINCSSSD